MQEDALKRAFSELWIAGVPACRIAKELEISKRHVHNLRPKYGLPPRTNNISSQPRAEIDVPLLFRLWHMHPSQMPTSEIAKKLGVSPSFLYRCRVKHKLPDRERVYHHEDDDPTPQEIAERAAEIRASWPEGEEARRSVGTRGRSWTPPSYVYDGRNCSYSGLV